jgi:hypothetical protein
MTVTTASGAGSAGDLERRDDLVTLTIDDVEISVPKNTLVIRAAELIGVQIPRFCDHPLLDPVARAGSAWSRFRTQATAGRCPSRRPRAR